MTTAQLTLFAAVLAQVALTIALYAQLVRTRFTLLKDRAQARPEMAYDQAAWPVKARLVSNAVINQFELPVLFYAAVLFAFQFGASGWIAALLAWLFFAARAAHALILTGSNVVKQRFVAFVVGFAVLIVFWLFLAIHVFSAGAL